MKKGIYPTEYGTKRRDTEPSESIDAVKFSEWKKDETDLFPFF